MLAPDSNMFEEILHPKQAAVLRLLQAAPGGETLGTPIPGYLDFTDPKIIDPASEYLAECFDLERDRVDCIVAANRIAHPLAEALGGQLGRIPVIGFYEYKDPDLAADLWPTLQKWTLRRSGLTVSAQPLRTVVVSTHLGKPNYLIPRSRLKDDTLHFSYAATIVNKGLGADKILADEGIPVHAVLLPRGQRRESVVEVHQPLRHAG